MFCRVISADRGNGPGLVLWPEHRQARDHREGVHKSGRQFIIDMYTAHVLRATGNDRLPQGEWDCIKVFLPGA